MISRPHNTTGIELDGPYARTHFERLRVALLRLRNAIKDAFSGSAR